MRTSSSRLAVYLTSRFRASRLVHSGAIVAATIAIRRHRETAKQSRRMTRWITSTRPWLAGAIHASSGRPDWHLRASLLHTSRMVRSLRRSGIMVTRKHSVPKRRQKRWCGRRDLNPHSPCGKTDFLAHLRLSPPLAIERKVWGLDYPFTVPVSGLQVLPV